MQRTVLSLVLVLSATACVHFERMGNVRESGEFSDTLEVTGPVELDVRTGAGRILVDTGDSDRVEIRGRVEARGWTSEEAFARVDAVVEAPPISQTGNRIRIGADGEPFRNVWISYDILAPAETTVRATTGSGGIEIRRVAGALEARTGSGAILLEDVVGDVRARTGSGRIDAREITGSFNGRTGSGGVTLRLIAPGDVDVQTGSGRIEIEGIDGALRADTGSGSIEVSGVPSARWDVEAGSGRIRLEIPEGQGFELDAQTPARRIELAREFTIDAVSEDDGEDSRNRRLRGTVGDGGPTVAVRTRAGGIEIVPRR